MSRSVALLSAVALTVAGSASAGGRPDALVAVGAAHRSAQVTLSARVGDALYTGVEAAAPRGGFVRVFPVFGGLPGVTGRYYPAAGILCFDRRQSACRRLPADARVALDVFGRLPLRRLAPTHAIRLAVGSSPINLPNLRTAVELAFERGGRPASRHQGGTRLDVSWRGPMARARPSSFHLRGNTLYSRGMRYELSRSAALYLRANR